MAGFEISSGKPGRLVVKFEYSEAAVAAIKQIPGRQWNPEGKFWTIPDTPEVRATLTELLAAPPNTTGELPVVAPKLSEQPPPKPPARSEPGKPLTTNPPHPLIKAVDDELVLRGMAYGTRKSAEAIGQSERSAAHEKAATVASGVEP